MIRIAVLWLGYSYIDKDTSIVARIPLLWLGYRNYG